MDPISLIVRNVPARFCRDDLVALWPPEGSYRLLYVPQKRHLKVSFGMAIITFVSVEAAQAFRKEWHAAKLPNHGNVSRPLSIVSAAIQGLVQNMQHLVARRVFTLRDASLHPAIFDEAGAPCTWEDALASALLL